VDASRGVTHTTEASGNDADWLSQVGRQVSPYSV